MASTQAAGNPRSISASPSPSPPARRPADRPGSARRVEARARPVAARHADASRKAARLANERSVVFAAPSPAPEGTLAEAYKTHKADTFLADFLNSPRKDAGDGKGCFSKRVTVSDAKLRDLGVGRDVFALGAESTDARRPDTEAAKAKAREAAGSNIFAENLEDSVAVRKGAESAVGAAHAATHSASRRISAPSRFAKAPNPRLAPRATPGALHLRRGDGGGGGGGDAPTSAERR